MFALAPVPYSLPGNLSIPVARSRIALLHPPCQKLQPPRTIKQSDLFSLADFYHVLRAGNTTRSIWYRCARTVEVSWPLSIVMESSMLDVLVVSHHTWWWLLTLHLVGGYGGPLTSSCRCRWPPMVKHEVVPSKSTWWAAGTVAVLIVVSLNRSGGRCPVVLLAAQ